MLKWKADAFLARPGKFGLTCSSFTLHRRDNDLKGDGVDLERSAFRRGTGIRPSRMRTQPQFLWPLGLDDVGVVRFFEAPQGDPITTLATV